MSTWRMALLLIAGVSYACVSHWMMLRHPSAPWAVAVLLGPLWLTALALAGHRFGGWGLAAAAALGVAGLALVWRGEAGDANRLYVLQHAAINALLCGWFGGTLRRGRLSLIGRFAERVHPLSDDQRRYTWQVTRVWSVFFGAMALSSIVVYLSLSFAAWSVLANLLTPLLVGALFIGEYLVRYRLHPEFERTRLVDALRAVYATQAERGARR
jgi:uncharacterized membrane protein